MVRALSGAAPLATLLSHAYPPSALLCYVKLQVQSVLWMTDMCFGVCADLGTSGGAKGAKGGATT